MRQRRPARPAGRIDPGCLSGRRGMASQRPGPAGARPGSCRSVSPARNAP